MEIEPWYSVKHPIKAVKTLLNAPTDFEMAIASADRLSGRNKATTLKQKVKGFVGNIKSEGLVLFPDDSWLGQVLKQRGRSLETHVTGDIDLVKTNRVDPSRIFNPPEKRGLITKGIQTVADVVSQTIATPPSWFGSPFMAGEVGVIPKSTVPKNIDIHLSARSQGLKLGDIDTFYRKSPKLKGGTTGSEFRQMSRTGQEAIRWTIEDEIIHRIDMAEITNPGIKSSYSPQRISIITDAKLINPDAYGQFPTSNTVRRLLGEKPPQQIPVGTFIDPNIDITLKTVDKMHGIPSDVGMEILGGSSNKQLLNEAILKKPYQKTELKNSPHCIL
jgi:hypothetical protein